MNAAVADYHTYKLIGAGLAAMGMIGAGVGLGVLFGNYLQAAIRNPAGRRRLARPCCSSAWR